MGRLHWLTKYEYSEMVFVQGWVQFGTPIWSWGHPPGEINDGITRPHVECMPNLKKKRVIMPMLKGMELKTLDDYGKKQGALFQRWTLNASIAQNYIIISTTFRIHYKIVNCHLIKWGLKWKVSSKV